MPRWIGGELLNFILNFQHNSLSIFEKFNIIFQNFTHNVQRIETGLCIIRLCELIVQAIFIDWSFILCIFIFFQNSLSAAGTWSNNYGPPYGSMTYAEWYALHQKYKKSTSITPVIYKFTRSPFQSTNKIWPSNVEKNQNVQKNYIHKPYWPIKSQQNFLKTKNINILKSTTWKPEIPKIVKSRNDTGVNNRLNNSKHKSEYKMKWCDYVRFIVGINKCNKINEKTDPNKTKTKKNQIKSKNTELIHVHKNNLTETGRIKPYVMMKKLSKTKTTTIVPIIQYEIIECKAKNVIEQVESVRKDEVRNSKFDTCVGFYGKCSSSHSCESKIACLHRITHQPCCTSPEINHHCPLVDNLGYECRKMNPVNWCNMDEDCGTSIMRAQICCPTGCGYNTCLKNPQKMPQKLFRKWSERNEDCPSPAHIPVKCSFSQQEIICNKADDCMATGEGRTRCCKTSCGYSICMIRLIDRWLIT